jgi:Disintegrin
MKLEATSDSASSGGCCKNCLIQPKGVVFRNSRNYICDVEEKCDGKSTFCPAENFGLNNVIQCGDHKHCASSFCTSCTEQCQAWMFSNRTNDNFRAYNSCTMQCWLDGKFYNTEFSYLDGTFCKGGTCTHGRCKKIHVLQSFRCCCFCC